MRQVACEPIVVVPSAADARRTTGVTAPRGFRAAGIHCGLRKRKPDLALLVSDVEASVAAVFTRNLVAAAPIEVSREALRSSHGRGYAVVVNAGNANACTGAPGLAAARRTGAEVAALLGVPVDGVLVASTGVIGQPLAIDVLVAGLPEAVSALSLAGGAEAAKAILTTDTTVKECARTVRTARGTYALGGMAKGSGMIHPNMATTLGFVTTDAAVDPGVLQRCLAAATEASFNRISVDGDTSTNDMVAVLANGVSGVVVGEEELPAFEAALTSLLIELARMVAKDGEGASKLITVEVTGARSDADAIQVGRTIAGSPLVKTAVHGADANWGRIVAAVGRAGVAIDPARLRVSLSGLEVLGPGFTSDFSEKEAKALLERDEVTIAVDLGAGEAQARTWTCDLTPGYVAINASYRS